MTLIDRIRRELAELDAARQKLRQMQPTDHCFVVMVVGIPITFELVNGQPSLPMPYPLLHCPLLCEEDAKSVAALTFNADGTKGEAVHIATAVERRITSLTESLLAIEQHQAFATASTKNHTTH